MLDANLSIYEHQSTLCLNMPLRSMIYFSQIIREMVKNKNTYGSTQVKIPVPYFVVFYNGMEQAPEQYELRLSDAFERQVDHPQIELICKVYNINAGNNAAIMEKCPTLREYTYFVELVRENFKQNGYEELGKAIDQAIDQCIQENVLRDFLTENRSEVTKVMQLDYTFERQIELEREAARSKAWEQGRLQEIFTSVQEGDYSVERGAQKAGMTVDEFQKVMAEAEQTLLLK